MSNQSNPVSKIVLVEDDSSFRRLLSMAINLRSDMQMIASYSNGRAALEGISEQTPDLILADYSMPALSGCDLLLEVRKRWPRMLFVLLSGHAEAEYAVNTLNAGANGYILKGRPQEIIEGIQAVLLGQRYVSPRIEALL